MSRIKYPVKLSHQQLRRIKPETKAGFRMRFPAGGIYYFVLFNRGHIAVYHHRYGRYRLVDSLLSDFCKPGFVRAYNHMLKLGWLN